MIVKVLLAISVLSLATLTLPPMTIAETPDKPSFDKMREKMEQFRTEIQQASPDARMKKKEAFKAQMENMSDERKKKIVERLETRLSSMSAKRQEHLLQAHVRMTEVYEKLVLKEQKLKGEGLDTASAAAALAEAKSALAKAKEQISAQNTEPYTVDLSNQSNLKGAVQSVMKKIQADAKDDRAILHAAKEALKKASRALGMHEKLKKGGTHGPKPTTSN